MIDIGWLGHIIRWIGAAVLGKIGGERMNTVPWVHGWLNSPKWDE
jgi:hypothetical protein